MVISFFTRQIGSVFMERRDSEAVTPKMNTGGDRVTKKKKKVIELIPIFSYLPGNLPMQ